MKIKNVSIQAFKSYLLPENGFFNFEIERAMGKKEIADFVSLYAPNGFGKTSFYDGVDFAITNNVNRYIKGKKAKSNASLSIDSGSKYILRNKNADQYEFETGKSLPTLLSVTTTKKSYKNEVTKPKSNQKTDYLSNRAKPENQRTDKTEFMERVLLSQESIDSFLRETNPQDRFNDFIKHSDSRLIELFEQREIIRKQCKELESAISKLEQDIDKNKIEVENIGSISSPFSEVNKIIQELNFLDLYEIRSFSSPFSQNDHEILKNELLIIKEKLQGHVRQKVDTKIALIEEFLNSEEEISSNLNDLNNLINQLKEEKIALEKIYEKEATEKRLNEEVSLISALKIDIQKINEAIEQIESYLLFVKELSELKNNKEQLISKLAAKKDYESEINLKHSELVKKSSEASKELFRLRDLIDRVEYIFKEIKSLEKLISNDKNEIEEKNSVIRNKKNQLRLFETELAIVKSFEILNPITIQPEWASETRNLAYNLNLYHNDYCENKNLIEKEEKSLSLLESKINDANMQSNSIINLINSASEIIDATKQSRCPVCNHDHANFDNLKSSFLSNNAFNDYQQSLRLSHNQTLNNLTSLKDTSRNQESLYRSRLIGVIERYESSISELAATIKIEEINSQNKTVSLEESLSRLSSLKEQTEFSEENEFSKSLLSKANNQQQIMVQLGEQKHKSFEQISLLNIEASQLESQLSEAQLRVNEKQQYLTQFKELIEILDLEDVAHSSNGLEIRQFLNDRLSIKNKALHQLVLDSEKLKRDMLMLKKEYSASSSEVTEKVDSLRKAISFKRSNLVKLLEVCNLFSIEMPDNEVSLVNVKELLIEKSPELYREREVYDLHLENCTILEKLSNQALEFSKLGLIKAEVYSLESKVALHKELLEPLENDLTKINKHIQTRANNFFNTPLINQIYESIDPHPDFKKVQFECTLHDKSKGELNIYAYDPSESLRSPPNLTFSSAQINVLSLSIFLARALTTKDDDKEDVNFIFIDDPIQSMDSINILSLIDLLRNLVVNFKKQIIISTHDENFHELLKRKIPNNLYKSKYLRLESFGKAIED